MVGFQNAEQPEFIGGTFAAASVSIEAMTEAAKEFGDTGLPVSAFIPGGVLIVLAFGSKTEAANALIPIRKKAWQRRHEDQEQAIEQARSEGKMAIRGTAADIRKYLAENGEGDDE